MPEPYEGFSDLYASVEEQHDVHERTWGAVDEAYEAFAVRHRAPRLRIADHVLTPEFRARRFADRLVDYLALTVTDLDEWTDTLLFHEHGVANLAILKGVLDWLSSNPDIRAQMDAAGVFDVDRCLSPEKRRENEILCVVRRFWRKCKPLVRELGYHRLMNIDSQGGGAGLGMDETGDRHIGIWSAHGRRDG